MPFKAALTDAQARAQSCILATIGGQTGPIAEGMIYAVSGGKGLRAFLVMESARLHRVEGAERAAAAIECIHGYSLVHDDLPCMDDDDLRRGQPTVHRKWDEATAVLVGDALQALGFELALETGHIGLVQSLARAAGLRGMVGGQALDIAAETAPVPLTLEEIITLQRGKTGALIEWSATAGAMLANADVSGLAQYGECLGLAFQIADDILDIEGDAAQVGKAVGKDEAAGKATFVSLLGLDGAKRRAAELVEEAQDALSSYGAEAETLKQAARFVIDRGH